MQYQISRNGQIYGPYTEDDLQRYVGTGNVLLTDLAKSETMTGWVPVSEILAGRTEAPAMPPLSPQQNVSQPGAFQPSYGQPAFAQPQYGQPGGVYGNDPYGVPAGSLMLANTSYPDPPRLAWGWVLLIDIFTCSLFQYLWNIYIAVWLRKIRPNAAPLYYFLGVALLHIVIASLGVSLLAHRYGSLDSNSALINLRRLLFVAAYVTNLVGRFSFRTILQSQYGPGGPENIGIDVNPVLLFFFGGLYLQSHLSRIAELKTAARMGR